MIIVIYKLSKDIKIYQDINSNIFNILYWTIILGTFNLCRL